MHIASVPLGTRSIHITVDPALKRWATIKIRFRLAASETSFISRLRFTSAFMHQNYLDQIDKDIAAKHLLKHPFYLAWTRGELSREALADYARQYYKHVAAFPTYLSAIHAKCDDQSTRKELLSNLIDEEAGSPNHPQLWLNFTEALGVSDVAVRHTDKQP